MDILTAIKKFSKFVMHVTTLFFSKSWTSWWKKQDRYSKTVKDIPGPVALPLVGTQWMYWIGTYSISKIHEVYKDLFEIYGPIVKEESLFNTPIISVINRHDIEKVFKSTGKYPIRPPTEVLSYYRSTRPDRYASGGLVNEQGIIWHNLRSSLTSELVSPRTIIGFVPQLEQICEDLCTLIRQDRNEKCLISDLKPYSERLGLETSCMLVLGRRMGFLYKEGISPDAIKLAEEVHHHFLACRDTYYGLPFWKLFPTPTYRKLIQSEDNIYNLVLKLVKSADEEARENVVFQSIINSDMDQREKTAAIVDFIAAGIYTLGHTVVFMLHLIGSRPDVQQKLYSRIKENDTTYLKACINEGFRLLPTAYLLARITEHNLDLSGYHVKSGSVVLCQLGLACRLESNFKNAKEFDPERWLGEEKIATANAATYLVAPFGMGKRMCPGKRFVEQTLATFVSLVVRQFRIECPQPLELEFEFILAPKGPVPLIFRDRDEN